LGRGIGFPVFRCYANFGRFWVVLPSRSDTVACLARWVGRWLSPLLALTVGLIGVLGTNSLISFAVPFEHHDAVVLVTLILALVLVITPRPRFYLTPVPSLVFWVPFLTHLYALMAGMISGVVLNPPFLLLISLLMIAIALYLHRPAIRPMLQSKNKPLE
jgi:hypothetical protein